MLRKIKNHKVRMGLIQMKLAIQDKLIDLWALVVPAFIVTGCFMGCLTFWAWVFGWSR